MKTPYNTGKVLIGCNYTPPLIYEYDGDMERLQSSLVRSPPRQVEAYRRHQRGAINEAILWAASVCLFAAIVKAPALWAIFTGN